MWAILGTFLALWIVKEIFGPSIEEYCDGTYRWARRFTSKQINFWRDKHNRIIQICLPTMERGKFKVKIYPAPGRLFDQMILPADVNDIINQIKPTLSDDKTFMPQRYGILLEGPPGNGKTQFITALATELNLPVNPLTLSSVFLGDESIRARVFSSFDEKSIVSIEDADAVFATNLVQNGKLNVDTLLSGIDGPYVPQKLVYVLSCNDKSLLPKKLLRRFPHRLTFNRPTSNDTVRIHDLYFPGSTVQQQQSFTNALNHANGNDPFVSFSDLEGCFKQVLYLPKNQRHAIFVQKLRDLERY